MKPKFDETIPAEISRLALERITSRQSFFDPIRYRRRHKNACTSFTLQNPKKHFGAEESKRTISRHEKKKHQTSQP